MEIPGPQPAVREMEIKEQDQIIPKDHMQGEQPRATRENNDDKVRKGTEKKTRTYEPAIQERDREKDRKGHLGPLN